MLIPDNILDFQSNGERLLYLRLKNDSNTNGMYILHSVFTNFHLKKISGELDFLILIPGQGIFAIEVKHGHIFRKDGIWHYENREGKITTKHHSPFSQVSGTLHSIRKYILDKIPKNSSDYERYKKFLFGTGVAFTSMEEFIDFGPEGFEWQLLTKKGLRVPPSQYLYSLSKKWHEYNENQSWYDPNSSRPTDKDCYKILQLLRGDFDITYTGLNKMLSEENLIDEFTREQFEILDFLNYNDRCLIQGAAGTGKTILALEYYQRKFAEGYKIAFFCFNRKLGEKLKEATDKLDNKPGCFVGTFHQFMLNKTSLSIPLDVDFSYSEELPISFLIENENVLEEEKFDLLIIDEAQDLITLNYLEVFDSILKGGLKKGKCVFFGDFFNQAIYINNPEESLEVLEQRMSVVKIPPLKINCRNTVKISRQNSLMTGVEKPVTSYKKPEGDPVTVMFKSNSKIIPELKMELEKLIAQGIPLDRFTILSTKKREMSSVHNSSELAEYFKNGLLFSTIHSYKGLENNVIFLVDFDELDLVQSQRLLYIGISRAKYKLIIFLEKKLEPIYSQLISKNLPKI